MVKMPETSLKTEATAYFVLREFIIAVDSLKLFLVLIAISSMTALRLDESPLAAMNVHELVGQGHEPGLGNLFVLGRNLGNHHLAPLEDGRRLAVDHKGIIAEIHGDQDS